MRRRRRSAAWARVPSPTWGLGAEAWGASCEEAVVVRLGVTESVDIGTLRGYVKSERKRGRGRNPGLVVEAWKSSEVARDADQLEAGLGHRVAQRRVVQGSVGQDGHLGGCARVEDDVDVLHAGDLAQFFADAHHAVAAGHAVDGQLNGAIDLGGHGFSLGLGLDEARDGRGRLVDFGLGGLV